MIDLKLGDCREIMAGLSPDSIDAVVTDPPYELGFMGKHWDSSGVAFSADTWRAALRVLKPGGHLLAFGGTRTFHRIAVAIEDAGFEIRDVVSWVYGSGFPKSLDVSKAIDREAGAEREVVGIRRDGCGNTASSIHKEDGFAAARGTVFSVTASATASAKEWEGWGTALKPAYEPIILARKPLVGTVAGNVLRYGTVAINIDGCRIGGGEKRETSTGGMASKSAPVFGRYSGPPASPTTTLAGRWPANFIHDGSDEVVALFPDDAGGGSGESRLTYGIGGDGILGGGGGGALVASYADHGSAARFFYCAKASRADRDEGLEAFASVPGSAVTGRAPGSAGAKASAYAGTTERPRRNIHPTVKPTALMRYLVRLVTPPGGTVLDPFMGSGSTGKAARLEGFDFIGIERESEYLEIARARIEHAEDVAEGRALPGEHPSQGLLFEEVAP